MANIPCIAVSSGEPFGIGPDIICQIAEREFAGQLVILGDKAILADRAHALGLSIKWVDYEPGVVRAHIPGQHYVLNIAAKRRASSSATPENADYILQMLKLAIDGCLSKQFDAMVTAPVNKAIINQGGYRFSGHTEYIAKHTQTKKVVMMLAGGDFRVALATTHIPLRDVASSINKTSLESSIRILVDDLQSRFAIPSPRIAIAGLNPHAGENGYLGREEIDTIIPVIESLKAEGLSLHGPYPADTLFIRDNLQKYDAFLAMYHDQGLPVLKHSHFDTAINITLGLPIIRTSVDHGTASDLVGSGKSNPESLWQAIQLASNLSEQQRD